MQAITKNFSEYKSAPDDLRGFSNAQRSKSKANRRRWIDPDGNIYEWDSQHGTVEVYNRRGMHRGEYDPETGKKLNEPIKGRKTMRLIKQITGFSNKTDMLVVKHVLTEQQYELAKATIIPNRDDPEYILDYPLTHQVVLELGLPASSEIEYFLEQATVN
jgi:hypothetical protein